MKAVKVEKAAKKLDEVCDGGEGGEASEGGGREEGDEGGEQQ